MSTDYLLQTPESIAEQALREFWDNSLPVDPVAIAKKMGVPVYLDPNLSGSGQLFTEKGQSRIHIRPNESVSRKRFTVAHELGHLCLGHCPRPRQDNTAYSFLNFDPVERDANSFAAAMLMPRPAVEHFVDIRYSFDSLVKRFNVSGRAMQIRLQRLGLL